MAYSRGGGTARSGVELGKKYVETQTATAGQTVFTLTTMSYSAGADDIDVYIQGVKQVSGVAFNETDSTTITFTEGLNVDDVVEFISWEF